jgi:hypothetical protein
VKSAASKKRKHDRDDATESTDEPARKKKNAEKSKKRSRDDDEDENEDGDADRTNKRAKKQGTNQSSTSTSRQTDPDASVSFAPDRASRSRVAADKRAVDAARSQVPRTVNSALWVNFDEVQPKPQSQAQTDAPGPVKEDEKTEKIEQKKEKKKPAAQRQMSAAARRRKVGSTLFHER